MNQLAFDFGISALADYDDDGHAQIQTDSPGLDGKAGTHPAEALLPLGLYARPLDPEPAVEGEVGLGAPVLLVTAGDQRYALPLNDPRDVKKLPKLRKGARMVAGGAGEHRSFLLIEGLDPKGVQAAGSTMLLVPYSKGGKKKSLGLSMTVRTPGAEEISIVHGEGNRVTLAPDGSITISSADGKTYAQVGNDGNVLAGVTKAQGSLTVGEQMAALPVASGPIVAQMITAIVATLVAVAAGASTIPTVVAAAPAQAAAPLPGIIAALMAKLQTLHLKST